MRYRWKTKPYKHQIAAVKLGLKRLKKTGGFALLMEPRTGKTKTTIDIFSILHEADKVHRVVIICPNSVIGVWEREIAAHCPERYKILIWDKKGRKTKSLPPFGRNVLDIVIINYEAFQIPGLKSRTGRQTRRGGRFKTRDDVRAWKPDLIVLDESHRIKSPSAKRTRMILSLAWHIYRSERTMLIPYRMILTGTVVTKKKRIFDVYSQWNFINPKSKLVSGHTLDSFKSEYGSWTNRNGYPQWLRNRNIIAMRNLLHRDAFAITRGECYDLPPRLPNQIIPVYLEESARAYQEMADEMIAMIESGEWTEAKIRLTQTLRLSQMTSGLAKTEPTEQYPEGRLARIGSEKLDAFRDWVIDQFEADQKVVVGARWRGDIAAITDLCRKMKVPTYELHGGVKSRTERDKNIEQFRVTQGAAIFVAQPAAGALGIDLSTSATGIWFSQTNSYVDHTQFEDRIALAKTSISWSYLIAEGTVDELLYVSLLQDSDVVNMILKKPQLLLGGGLELLTKN